MQKNQKKKGKTKYKKNQLKKEKNPGKQHYNKNIYKRYVHK